MDRPPNVPSPSSMSSAPQLAISNHPLSPHSHPGPSSNRRPSSFISTVRPRSPLPAAAPSSDYFTDPTSDIGLGSGMGHGVTATTEELLGTLPTGSSRSSPKKRSGGRVLVEGLEVLEGMSEGEMEVVRMRWDQMGDEEIRKVLLEWDNRGIEPRSMSMSTPSIKSEQRGNLIDPPTQSSSPTVSTPIPISTPLSDQPLFPPSPPPIPPPAGYAGLLVENTKQQDGLTNGKVDHPLRVLARAVLELQETVGRLRRENEELRAELSRGKNGQGVVRGRQGVDTASLHDGLSEAISTSLTSPPILSVQSVHSGRLPHPPRVPSPAPSTSSHRSQQSRPKSPSYSIYTPESRQSLIPSNRSIRSMDSRQVEGVIPSNRSVRSVDIAPAPRHPHNTSLAQGSSKKRDARSSWTASLWGWGNGSSGTTAKRGTQRDRKGSVSSSLREEIRHDEEEGQNGDEGEGGEGEGWRRGDGGSSPGYKAIFLATRLLTPDPLSILAPSHIQPNSLLAYLAHSLVSTARDDGISIKDPLNRRRPSRESRSRAASIMSQESQYTSGTGSRPDIETSTSSRKDKSYTDTLVATASYGRSFFTNVSGSTLRGTRSKAANSLTSGEDTIRPSLLSRTSARTFPTTAITPTTTIDTSTKNDLDDQPVPSVEMASIVADENQPPTVLLSRRHLGGYFQTGKIGVVATRFSGADPPLTDRYGFIYDIQHAGMLKDASIAGAPAPASLNGIIPGLEEGEGWIDSRRRTSQDTRPELSRRSTGSTESVRSSPSIGISQAVETASSGTSGRATPTGKRFASKENTDNRHRSSTIISLNPSPARPITAKDTLTVSARGASSLRSAVSPPLVDPPPSSGTPDIAASRATVSSLLDKLTDIHDRQQAERKAEWDVWFRKHRAKGSKKVEIGGQGAGWGGDMIGISQMGLGDAEDWRGFARLVRRGIPLAYRADIWAECSGAKDALVPGEYQEILSVHANDTLPVLADIEKDVSRTFPGNMFFGGDGPGVAKLRRVLLAYSWRNPSVGYCQGMNMLAATLLLTHTDEEQAFWVLSAILDRLLPQDFYSPSLLASRTDQLVLADLVALYLPKLSAHLEELGVDLASITFGWFLSFFTDCLPVETLFRVWDVFFVEGHDTLFRVALAILKINEAEICSTESAGDLFVFVSGMTSRLWAADKLIALQHSFKTTIKHADISGRYSRHLASLHEM